MGEMAGRERGRQGAATAPTVGKEENGGRWMRVCSEEGGIIGHSLSSTSDVAERQVGVGTAREMAGPGKKRRVTTLARWEPSARAHMLACLADATIDVTGD